MKTTNSITVLLVSGLLVSMGACRTTDSTSDVMEDTTLNQDTAYQTDTIRPVDLDPRAEGIQSELPVDSLGGEKPEGNSPPRD